MRLTVLGNAGAYLAPLSGGSGYLVEHEGTRLLLDCGGGVRDALRSAAVDRVDGVVLSHFHYDHVLDFVSVDALVRDETPVFVPPGERARLAALAEGFVFRGAWDVGGLRDAAPGARFRVGSLTLSFAPSQHSAPAVATRVESDDGAALVYASDSAPCDALRELARDADLLLMHTLLPTVDAATHHAQMHATAASAAALAKEEGARRLLLSHRFHESPDAAMVEAAALHGFPTVELARDRGRVAVTARGA